MRPSGRNSSEVGYRNVVLGEEQFNKPKTLASPRTHITYNRLECGDKSLLKL